VHLGENVGDIGPAGPNLPNVECGSATGQQQSASFTAMLKSRNGYSYKHRS